MYKLVTATLRRPAWHKYKENTSLYWCIFVCRVVRSTTLSSVDSESRNITTKRGRVSVKCRKKAGRFPSLQFLRLFKRPLEHSINGRIVVVSTRSKGLRGRCREQHHRMHAFYCSGSLFWRRAKAKWKWNRPPWEISRTANLAEKNAPSVLFLQKQRYKWKGLIVSNDRNKRDKKERVLSRGQMRLLFGKPSFESYEGLRIL